MKKLGVIGGMGPIATAYFHELVTKMTDASRDQDHISMIFICNPSIPDRTDYILGKSADSPLMPMLLIGQSLTLLGADFIAIPCVTAHYFHDELSAGIAAPVIHIVTETVKLLKEHKIMRAGIMATEGTIKSGLFQKELHKEGIYPVIPSPKSQDIITELIFKDIKSGKPIDLDKFMKAAGELKACGADTVILGCTELSLVKRDYELGSGYLDAMEVLAARAIKLCGAKLKKEYETLIT